MPLPCVFVELMVRCSLPDRPGRLAAIAGAIGAAGGDIQAVVVVETDGETALDDLHVLVEPEQIGGLVAGLERLDGTEVVHVGPSRGLPGDAVTRLAMGVEGILSGSMELEHGVQALVGGLLSASSVTLERLDRAPQRDRRVLVLGFDDRLLVVRREYRFCDAEIERARAVVKACIEAARRRREPAPT